MDKVIFFQPHPDDLELNCGNILYYLSKQGRKKYEIKVASITKGEFGLPGYKYDKFKGNFLAKIRTIELTNALKIYGIPKENLTFFDYVDGFVPFNWSIINKITSYLEKEKPNIIFAPEAIYTAYYHLDHVNTGKAVFYSIQHFIRFKKPILFFYGTLFPNFFFGVSKENFTRIDNLLKCHKTQFWLINYLKLKYKPNLRFWGLKLKGWTYAEKFRKIQFDNQTQIKNHPSLVVKCLSHWYSSMPWFKAKYPKAIKLTMSD
jgi:LmbE family N-acetylglucosaminyl deacetylase